MRRIISMFLVLIFAISSISFAQKNEYKIVGEELKSLGIIKGQDGGELNENGKLTREQAIVVLTRMLGEESVLERIKLDHTKFKDVPKNNFYARYIAYAQGKGWTNGISEDKFGFGQNISTKAVATYFMRALGHSVDWSKDDVMIKAKELGIMNNVSSKENEDMIRGEVFIMMKNTLNSNPKGRDRNLKSILGLSEDESEFGIANIKATNLVEIVVDFNRKLDSRNLKNAFTIKSDESRIESIKLKGNGKGVVLSIDNALKNRNSYELLISGLKSIDGDEIKKATKLFKVEDLKLPDVVGVKALSPTSALVKFSEPILELGEIYLKNEFTGDISLELHRTEASDTVKVLGIKLDEGYRYVFEIKGFKDYAGYSNLDKILELKVEAIKTAPKFEVIEAKPAYVHIRFNREVRGLSKENFYHSYSTWKPISLYRNLADMNNEKNQVKIDDRVIDLYVQFAKGIEKGTYPLVAGENKFTALSSVGTRKVLDNWDNQLENKTEKVFVKTSSSRPRVVDIKVSGENQLTLYFSKKIEPARRTNFNFLKENLEKYKGLYADIVTKSEKVIIDFKKVDLTNQTIVVEVMDIVDTTILKNKMVGKYSASIKFEDVVFKGITEIVRVLEDGVPVFKLVYGEDVILEGAKNTKNYSFSNDKIKFFQVPDFLIESKSNNIFEFRFTKEQADKYKLEDVNSISISNKISDTSGNTISGFEEKYSVSARASEFSLVKAVASSSKDVELEFDKNLLTSDGATISTDGFKFYSKAGEVVPIKVDIADFKKNKENRTNIVSLKLRSYTGDLVLSSNTDLLVGYTGSQLVTSLGGKIEASNKVEIQDAISPKYKKIPVESIKSSINYAVIDNNPKKVKSVTGEERYQFNIVIRYDEPLKASTFSKSTYKIDFAPNSFVIDRVISIGSEVNLLFSISEADYKGWSEYTDEGVLKLNNGKHLNKTDMKLKLNENNTIEDLKGNEFVGVGKTDVYIGNISDVEIEK